jgi:predicted Zn-dependent protease
MNKKFNYIKVLKFIVLTLILLAVILGYLYKNKWDKVESNFREGQNELAAEHLKYLPQPKNSEKLKMYAQIKFIDGQIEQSRSAYQELIDKTDDPFSKIMVGNIYNSQKKTDLAIEQYRDLIESNPNYIQAYINLASVYNINGKKEKAIEVLKNGSKDNPNSVNIYALALSISSSDKESDDYQWAKSGLEKVDPNNDLLD